MGRSLEHFSRFTSRHIWTCLFLVHTLTEVFLGAAKLRGFYKFERAAHDKDLKAKAGSRRKRDRVKLVQYTTYHGLARVALGLLLSLIHI